MLSHVDIGKVQDAVDSPSSVLDEFPSGAVDEFDAVQDGFKLSDVGIANCKTAVCRTPILKGCGYLPEVKAKARAQFNAFHENVTVMKTTPPPEAD